MNVWSSLHFCNLCLAGMPAWRCVYGRGKVCQLNEFHNKHRSIYPQADIPKQQVYVWMCIFVLEKIVTREIFIYFAAFHRFSEGFSCIQHFYIFYAIPGLYDTTPITQMHIHMHIRVHIFIHKHINQFKSKYRNTRDALLQIYKYKKNWERRNGNTRTYLTTATT